MAERDRRRRAAKAEQAEADKREQKETVERLVASNVRNSRKIAELKRNVEDLTAEQNAAASSGAALGQGGRAKNDFFFPDDVDDNNESVRPADEESDKHDDVDANNLDGGIERVLGNQPQASVLFRRLTGLELTELTELVCRTTKCITLMSNTGEISQKRAHMGTWKVQPTMPTEPPVTDSSLAASSGRR